MSKVKKKFLAESWERFPDGKTYWAWAVPKEGLEVLTYGKLETHLDKAGRFLLQMQERCVITVFLRE